MLEVRGGRGPIVRNKANSPVPITRRHRRPGAHVRPPLGTGVRNKANSTEAAGRASTWWKGTYGELNMQETAAKQSQFPHGPHWAKAGNAAAAGNNRAKQSQFSGGTPGMGEGRQGRPSRRRRAKACETKPIPPERHEGQVLWGKRVMVNWSHKRLWRNKANFSIADRGQTFDGTPALRGPIAQDEPNFAGRPGPQRTKCAKRSQFGARRAAAGLVVQNEPNFRRADVPHHSTIQLLHHSMPMAIVQNEPNFGATTDRSRFEDLPLGRWAGRLSGEGKGYAEPHKTRWRKE